METFNEIIAENIGLALERSGLTQLELAKRANISPVSLNKVIKRKRPAGKAMVKAIAEALGLSEADLINARFATEQSTQQPLTLAPETVKSLASELNKFILPPMTSDEAKTLELLKEDARAAKLFSLFLKLSERGRDLLIRKAEDLLEIHPAPPRDR